MLEGIDSDLGPSVRCATSYFNMYHYCIYIWWSPFIVFSLEAKLANADPGERWKFNDRRRFMAVKREQYELIS